MTRFLLPFIAAGALALGGCAGTQQAEERESVSAPMQGATASSCVTHTGTCALSGARPVNSDCWCNFGYYTRTGFAQ